jgi:UDP-3-O-[3-hydroxymyristoyl] N-acetylglucosamine deacetylase
MNHKLVTALLADPSSYRIEELQAEEAASEEGVGQAQTA